MTIRWQVAACSPESAGFLAAWQALVDEHCAGNAALDARFQRLLLRHYGDGNELSATAYAGERPVAAVILARAGMAGWTLFQPGQACLSPFVHAPDFDVAAGLHELTRALPGRCWRLQLPKIDPLYQDVRQLDPERSDTADYGETFLIDLDCSFEDYWGARKKRLRQNSRRWFRKVEQEGYAIRFESLAAQADMPRAVATHAGLESAGWKGEHGSAIGADNRQGRFYEELLSDFAATGAALTFQLYFDDVPAASLLGIVGGSTLVILKTAHNESIRECSPGRIIDYLAIERCCADDRLNAMDMYTRASSADLSWATSTRTMQTVDLYSSRMVKSAVQALRRVRSLGGRR